MCKPGVSDCLSLDGRWEVLPIRPDPVPASESNSTPDTPCGIHGVRHYWLCERCSHVFTLAYEEGYGVVLKHRLWLPAGLGQQEMEVSLRSSDQDSSGLDVITVTNPFKERQSASVRLSTVSKH